MLQTEVVRDGVRYKMDVRVYVFQIWTEDKTKVEQGIPARDVATAWTQLGCHVANMKNIKRVQLKESKPALMVLDVQEKPE